MILVEAERLVGVKDLLNVLPPARAVCAVDCPINKAFLQAHQLFEILQLASNKWFDIPACYQSYSTTSSRSDLLSSSSCPPRNRRLCICRLRIRWHRRRRRWSLNMSDIISINISFWFQLTITDVAIVYLLQHLWPYVGVACFVCLNSTWLKLDNLGDTTGSCHFLLYS